MVNCWCEPSELIKLAVADLEKAEKAKNVINMGNWCVYDVSNKKCSVCFAGSVMVNTLGNKTPVKNLLAGKDLYGEEVSSEDLWNTEISIDPCDFPKEELALEALNKFREGRIEEGFYQLDIELPDDIVTNVKVSSYNGNKVKFKNQMKELAKALKKKGY